MLHIHKFTLVLIALLSGYILHAQISWEWAEMESSTGHDFASDIATDHQGNIYLTGVFSNSSDFGDTTLSAVSNYDGFLVKYDENRNTIWANQWGSTSSSMGKNILVDDDLNIYLLGELNGTPFVSKLDSNGSVLWTNNLPYGDISWTQKGRLMVKNGNRICVGTSSRFHTFFYFGPVKKTRYLFRQNVSHPGTLQDLPFAIKTSFFYQTVA